MNQQSTEISNEPNQIPFAFGMDYVVDERDWKIYCIEVNPGSHLYFNYPWSAWYYHMISWKIKGTIQSIITWFIHKPYSKEIYLTTRRKSDQARFIPEEYYPKSIILHKDDFCLLGKKTDERLEKEEKLLRSSKIIVAKLDNSSQWRWVVLLKTEELQKNTSLLARSLIGDFKTRFHNANRQACPELYYWGALYFGQILWNYAGFSFEKEGSMEYVYNSLTHGLMWYIFAGMCINIFGPGFSYNKEKMIVLQEYISPKSADLWPQNKPACMRHLIQGKYNIETWEILTTLDTFSQRLWDIIDVENLDNKSGVINYSHNGTQVVHASEREKERAQELTHKIIHNIFAEVYSPYRSV